MKRLTALVIACLLCVTTAYAAEWGEGLSAAKPYTGVPEVNLEESMGYIMLYPRTKMPAAEFCDVLEIYLPREDIALGEGKLTLCDENGEVEAISFAESDRVELRPLEDVELDGLMWGSGVCIEVRLTKSLRFDGSYYVLMEKGCFTAADGKIESLEIVNPEAWTPVVNGDFGISGLYYSAAAEAPEAADGEEAEAEEAVEAAEEAAPAEAKRVPEVGDAITFDVVLGGEAKTAVMFSENGSALFDVLEYTESGTVTGRVVAEPLNWGVVFLDDAGEVLDVLQLTFDAQE